MGVQVPLPSETWTFLCPVFEWTFAYDSDHVPTPKVSSAEIALICSSYGHNILFFNHLKTGLPFCLVFEWFFSWPVIQTTFSHFVVTKFMV